MNEFKISALRQFGSENVSFSAIVHSDKQTLSEEEIAEQVNQVSVVIGKAFKSVIDREISEKDVLIEASERKVAAVKRYDDQLKAEMKVKTDAGQTLKDAERLDRKLTKNK